MLHLEKIQKHTLHCSDIIKFGSWNDIPFLATSASSAILTVLSLKQWLKETFNKLFNEVIPKSFWELNSLTVPELPSLLRSQKLEGNKSKIFLLIIIWCYLSEEICKLIFDCLNAGMKHWQTSELFCHADWIKMYVNCVMKYMIYAEKLVDSCICKESEEKNLLLNEAMFSLPVILSTSKLFEIVTDPETSRLLKDNFLRSCPNQVQRHHQCQIPFIISAPLLLCSVSNDLKIISLLDVFKVTYFIPMLQKFFKLESFTCFAKIIHSLLRKEIADEKLFLVALDKACQEGATTLKISTEDNPQSKYVLIVFVKVVSDFLQYSKTKVVTEKEILVMKMLYPAYKYRDGENTESKLKRIMEYKETPLLPHHFVMDMIQSQFKLQYDKWHYYYNLSNSSVVELGIPNLEKEEESSKQASISKKLRLRFSIKKERE